MKKLLSVLLAIMMLVSVISVPAFAEGETETFSVVYNYIGEDGVTAATKVVDLTNPVDDPTTVDDTTATKQFAVGDTFDQEYIDFIAPNLADKYFVGWYDNAELEGSPVDSLELANAGANNLYARYKEYKSEMNAFVSANKGESGVGSVILPAITNKRSAAAGSVSGNYYEYPVYSKDIESTAWAQTVLEKTDEDGNVYTEVTNNSNGASTSHILVDEEGMAYQFRSGRTYVVTLEARVGNSAGGTLQFGVGKDKSQLIHNVWGTANWYNGNNALATSTSAGTVSGTEWAKYTATVTPSETALDSTAYYQVFGIRLSSFGKSTDDLPVTIDIRNVKIEEVCVQYIVDGEVIYEGTETTAGETYYPNRMLDSQYVPADSYFVGWFDNAECTGSPVGTKKGGTEAYGGVTAANGVTKLYAGFKPYETTFEANVPVDGTNTPNVYFPHTSVGTDDNGTFYANVRAGTYFSAVKYIEDASGNYWEIKGNATTPILLADENGIAYQVRSGVSYKVTLEYRSGAADKSFSLQTGIGKLKSEVTKAKMGDSNGLWKTSSSVTVSDTTAWNTAEFTIAAVDFGSDYYPLIGLRATNGFSSGGVLQVKNIQVEAQVAEVNYVAGSKTLKSETVAAGETYKPNLDLTLAENISNVPAGYYFTGWYDNADCTGSPVSREGFATEAAETYTLYAGFKAYEKEFTPSYDDSAFETHVDYGAGTRTYIYFPVTIENTYIASVQAFKWGWVADSTLVEDGGEQIWHINGAGSGFIHFFDENGVAYQAKPDTSYTVTFKARGEFSTAEEDKTIRLGIGLTKADMTSSTSLGDITNYAYQTAPTPVVSGTEWNEYTLTLDASKQIASADLYTNVLPLMGLRIFIESGEYFELKDVVVKTCTTDVEYVVDGKVIKTDTVAASTTYNPSVNLNVGEYAQYLPENSYFTGWYENADCTGTPLTNDGFTTEIGTKKLYAGIREYEESFAPVFGSTSGYRIAFPATLTGDVYTSTIVANRYGGIVYVTDGDYYSKTITGANGWLFHDANNIAYRAKAGAKYRISLEYQYSSTRDQDSFLRVGVGLPNDKLNTAAGNEGGYLSETPANFTAYKEITLTAGTGVAQWTEASFDFDLSTYNFSNAQMVFGMGNPYAKDLTLKVRNIKVEMIAPAEEGEYSEAIGGYVYEVGTVEDAQSYAVDFDYTGAAAEFGFFTADKEGAGVYANVGYVEATNKAILSVTGDGSYTAYLTTDKKTVSGTAQGNTLYMYAIGATEATGEIYGLEATNLKDESGNTFIGNAGVMILTDEAEAASGNQALRYLFTYDTTDGTNILIGDKSFEVVKRGFIFANGEGLADDGINLSATSGTVNRYVSGDALKNCWEATQIGTSANSNIQFSTYVSGFAANDTRVLFVKGYVTFKDAAGNEFTLYSTGSAESVASVAQQLG